MAAWQLLGAAASHWWTLLVRGILAVLFALVAFTRPDITLAALVLVWGAFAIADGIVAIVTGAKSRWWAVLIWGVLGVGAGLVALFMPGITALVLLMVVAAWAIVRGIFEIVAAIRLRAEITGEWFLILSGLVSIVFGAIMFLFPGAGALALVWLIGAHAFVVGVLLIALALRLRRIGKTLARGRTLRALSAVDSSGMPVREKALS